MSRRVPPDRRPLRVRRANRDLLRPGLPPAHLPARRLHRRRLATNVKVTLGCDDTFITISDPHIGYSPDVLTDWSRRALETLTAFTIALARVDTTEIDGEQ